MSLIKVSKADPPLRDRSSLCNRSIFRQVFAGLSVLGVLLLTSCASVVPKRLPHDRFDYNEAISQSSKQQMLTNIVRIRYLDFPVFVSVSSIITSYDYAGSIGLEGTAGLPDALGGDGITGSANLAFAERPTITYTPLSGREFTQRLLSPIPVEAIFWLGQAGWDNDMLLLTGINRINNVENLSFEVNPVRGATSAEQSQRRDIENLGKFRRAIDLLWYLADQEVIELQRENESSLPKLVFDPDGRQQYLPLVDELKDLLELDSGRNVFQVTTRIARRQSDEISFQSRSLTSIMAFLAKGVDVPQVHIVKGWTEPIPVQKSVDDQFFIPLRVHSQQERPIDAFVAVQYQGYWFYLDQADLQSKLVFQMLSARFELQAPAGRAAAPLLTLPTGR